MTTLDVTVPATRLKGWDSVEFYVGNGPGLTVAKRDDLWQRREDLPGQYIVYTYQEIGTTNAPRLPQLKGFRPDWDIVGLRR